MHADTDTGADVTARALAAVGAARARADALRPWLASKSQKHGSESSVAPEEVIPVVADVPLLAAYALAGLALRREIEEQWGPGGDALAAYDAAIRAAGEAGQ